MPAATLLDADGDWVTILAVAAVAGGIASLIAELLIARGSDRGTGMIEMPTRVGRTWIDLGSLAAIPTGVLAAVIAAFALAPVQEVVTGRLALVSHQAATTQNVEMDKLVLISILAGLSSSAFLRVVQERFTAIAKSQRLDAALGATLSSLDELVGQVQSAAADATPAETAFVEAADSAAKAEHAASQIANRISGVVEAQAQQVRVAAAALVADAPPPS